MAADTSDDDETTGHSPPPPGASNQKYAHLIVLSGPNFGDLHRLETGRTLVVGRQASADIRLSEEVISRRHFAITAVGEGAYVEDLDSQNGTFVEGVRTKAATLKDGQRVQVGFGTTLKFTFTDELEAEYQRKLADGAMREPMTELYNRRHFEERMAAEFAAARRHSRTLSLMMIDIDHFKDINDRHGHLAGDTVLKAVAQALRDAVRKEDVLARYGGEEFIVLARESDSLGTRVLADRIRGVVESLHCEWKGQLIRVTVSIGIKVALLSEQGLITEEQELIDAADQALYAAKEQGRNCVVDADDNVGDT